MRVLSVATIVCERARLKQSAAMMTVHRVKQCDLRSIFRKVLVKVVAVIPTM